MKIIKREHRDHFPERVMQVNSVTADEVHRYGVIGFTVVTITEVDPETLKPVGPPITYTP